MLTFLEVSGLVHAASEPELHYTPSQKPVVTLTVAANYKWTGDDNKEHDESCFIGCTGWGKTAENISKFVKKGDPLYVVGSLKQDSWEKDGIKHTRHTLLINRIIFLKPKE
jgi:single-strand DNA-binding protein